MLKLNKTKTRILMGLAPLALATAFVAAPGNAEARIVCHEGWRWEGAHCVQVNRYHHRDYIVGERYRDEYRVVPRARLVHLDRAPYGHRYVMGRGGEVILLDRGHRVVHVYH